MTPASFHAILGAMLAGSEPSPPAHPVERLLDAPAPEEIRGGRVTEPGEYEAVVALRAHLRICSGVMVSSTVLLTAAHCIADAGFGQQVTMYHGPTVDDERRHQADAWAAHPSYCPDCREDWFDIGYVVLTLPYELMGDGSEHPIPVATQDEWDELMREGRALEVVGYGSGEGEDGGIRTKRVAEVELVDLMKSGRELHAEPMNGRTCGGDSGGAYLATGSDGKQRLVAIHSRSERCGGTMTSTPPLPALCWLRDETGVDLLPPENADCSSVETARGGCRVDVGGSGGFLLVLLVSSIGLVPRRARRTIAA